MLHTNLFETTDANYEYYYAEGWQMNINLTPAYFAWKPSYGERLPHEYDSGRANIA